MKKELSHVIRTKGYCPDKPCNECPIRCDELISGDGATHKKRYEMALKIWCDKYDESELMEELL